MNLLKRKITVNALGYIISHVVVIVAVVLGFRVAFWVPLAVIPTAGLVGLLLAYQKEK